MASSSVKTIAAAALMAVAGIAGASAQIGSATPTSRPRRAR